MDLRPPTRTPIEEVRGADLARATFYSRFVDAQRPVVLRGLALSWPACAESSPRKWSFARLAGLGGDRDVTVSLSNEERERTVKARMPISRLVELVLAQQTAAATSAAAETVAAVRDGDREGVRENAIPYLKQFDLMSFIPELRHDLDLRLWNWRTWTSIAAWLGPKGSVTGVHSDDENNISVQIVGKKRFLLFPPEQRHLLYVNSKYDPGTECADVQADDPDMAEHPLFAQATPFEAVLGAGDALFIPRGWWHHVRSLEASLSVNYFASTPWEVLRDGTVRLFYWILHNVGLYKPGNCVCHARTMLKAD